MNPTNMTTDELAAWERLVKRGGLKLGSHEWRKLLAMYVARIREERP